jgi:hypothetical protein
MRERHRPQRTQRARVTDPAQTGQVYSERKALDGMAQRARTVALEKYSLERALREYRKVLSS